MTDIQRVKTFTPGKRRGGGLSSEGGGGAKSKVMLVL